MVCSKAVWGLLGRKPHKFVSPSEATIISGSVTQAPQAYLLAIVVGTLKAQIGLLAAPVALWLAQPEW